MAIANLEMRMKINEKTRMVEFEHVGRPKLEVCCAVCRQWEALDEYTMGNFCGVCGAFVCGELRKGDGLLGCTRLGCTCQQLARKVYPVLAARMDEVEIAEGAGLVTAESADGLTLSERLRDALALRMKARRWKGEQYAQAALIA